MQKIILFSLFTVSTCQLIPSLLNSPLLHDLDLTDIPLVGNLVDSLWGKYKESHGKSYSPEEDAKRRETFTDRLLRIVAVNLDKLTYKLGLNKYSDLNHDEYMQYLNGVKFNNDSKTSPQPHLQQKSHTKLPKKVDWRDKGYVTPVQDQTYCGACWAFSAAGALEAQNKNKTGSLVALSAENLLDCVKDNYGCDGGLMDPAFEYVKQKGIDTEKSYPYTGTTDSCLFQSTKVGAKCKAFVDIPSGDEAALKHAVATIGPVSIAIDADSEDFQSYESGILDLPNCRNDKNSLTHAILVIGYGTENGLDYWLIKNSWGPTWGIKGYGKLSRNKNNQCGVATLASYPLL